MVMKADDTYKYEDEDGKIIETSLTEFELLKEQVGLLIRLINQHAEILNQNKLRLSIDAGVYDDAEIYENALRPKE